MRKRMLAIALCLVMVSAFAVTSAVSAKPAESGQLKWSYQTGGKINVSPAVAGNVVYVGSTDGKLYAIST